MKIAVFSLLVATVSLACSPQPNATAVVRPTGSDRVEADHAPGQEPAVTRVEPSLVCMVNNQYMGKPQIPVVVDGSTYFGCCEMCKGRLAQDVESRVAVDPVSGTRVDKARAVIGREQSGTVVYFENEANLERYAAR